jgi:hypothetical protein
MIRILNAYCCSYAATKALKLDIFFTMPFSPNQSQTIHWKGTIKQQLLWQRGAAG